MTAIDLSKQQALDADPTIQKQYSDLNLLEILSGYKNRLMFFIIEEIRQN